MKNYITSFAITMLALALIMSPLASFAKENSNNKSDNSNKSEKVEKVEQNKRSVTTSTLRLEKDKETNDDNKKSDESEKNSSSNSNKNATFGKCFKAYGHLVAPGWIKNNGASDIDVSNCWLPFGINKKFRGNNASTTPDVTAPVIRNVVTSFGTTTINVGWKTNENATSKVFYSTTNPLNVSATTTSFITNSALTLNHSISVMGLATSTAYYFKVQSVDASGNTVTSGQVSATTNSGM
jgi:hypothetical protein